MHWGIEGCIGGMCDPISNVHCFLLERHLRQRTTLLWSQLDK
jgi:hypothetical protein